MGEMRRMGAPETGAEKPEKKEKRVFTWESTLADLEAEVKREREIAGGKPWDPEEAKTARLQRLGKTAAPEPTPPHELQPTQTDIIDRIDTLCVEVGQTVLKVAS